MESTLIANYEKQESLKINPCDQITRYCTLGVDELQTEISPNCYRLIGRADGMYGDTVIECKCRRNGFRDFFFEKIQLALYVIGYKKKRGELLEMFEGEIRCYVMSFSEAQKIFHNVKIPLDRWVCENICKIKTATS